MVCNAHKCQKLTNVIFTTSVAIIIIARNVLIDNKCHKFRNTECHKCHNHKQARRNRGIGLNQEQINWISRIF